MAYQSDKHTAFIRDKSTQIDNLDNLLVNLYDTVHSYRSDMENVSRVNDVLESVADLLDAELTPSERNMASDVLVGLVKQAERDMRVNLAERFACRDDLNTSLLHFLAYDDIEVAEPVLLRSPLLRETDLLYIIQSKFEKHWRVIAKRPNITDNVLCNLLEKKDEVTAINVLKNETISMSDEAFKRLTPIARESSGMAEELLSYKGLPHRVAVDLYWHVSNALRDQIVERFDVKGTDIDAALQDSLQDFSDTVGMSGDGFKPSALMLNVADQYYSSDNITDSMLISTLRRRQGRFFVALFSKRSQLSHAVVTDMMGQIGGQGMAVACRAMNISKENFVSVFLLCRTIVKASQAVDANELKMAMRYYDGLTHKMAKEILKDSIA